MFRRILLASCFTLAAPLSFAQARLSIEDLWRPPQYLNPTLSHNGRYFAARFPLNGRLNLAVVDLETMKPTVLTNYKDSDVVSVDWVGNERLVFTLGKFNAPSGPFREEGGGLFMVSRDGKESRQLSPTFQEMLRGTDDKLSLVPRGYELYRTLPDNDEEILATGNMVERNTADLYRLNVRTGRATLLSRIRPTRSFDWVLDNNLVPRVVTAAEKDYKVAVVYYRKDGDSPWEEIYRYEQTKGPTFVPLVFEQDNQTLQVAFNGGRPTMAVFRYDPNAKKFGEMLAAHPRYDMGADGEGQDVPGVLTDFKTGKVLGYRVEAEKPQTVWVDEGYARIQRMIDAALPDTYNTFSRTPDGDRLIVTARSDLSQARWYMLDEKKRTLQELFASRPWLKPEMLVAQHPFTYKTRDGLEIDGYYFLPKNYKSGDKLPTIVHIHGGPAARADTWGRLGFGVREAQLFASRGYAVVVPNYRITTGLGSRIYYSGFGTIGRQMSDDHEDAAQWAIAEGFADPKRVCISGASYGGYATLMALARAPNFWKCGISGLMVSNLERQVTSPSGDTYYFESAVEFWNKIVGAEKPSQYPHDVSPVYLADKIKAPLFVYAGDEDIRTPLEQTRAMRNALERAGNPPKDVYIGEQEGHGFGKLEHNVELYTRILKFLEEQIGPGSKN